MIGRREPKGEKREIKHNIVRQYSRFESMIARFSRWVSSWTDRFLFSEKYGKLVALLLAIFVYAIINIGDSATSMFETTQSYIYRSQPVTALISSEAYEVSGLPETVDVRLMGNINDLQMIRQQQSTLRVVADLSGLGEGRSEVQFEVQNIPSRVEVSIEPTSASVVLKKKVTKTYELGYDFVNQSKMDVTYDLGEPKFDSNSVQVRASEDTLKEVSFVKALIDVSGVSQDFEVDAPLAAYDAKGNRLEVDIIPQTMKTKVKVTQPKKTVDIRVVPVGTMQDDLALASCTLSQQKITLYAKQSVLDEISAIDVSLPVSNITFDQTLSLPITLPNGITKADLEEVTIRVSVGEKSSKTFEDIAVQLQGADRLEGKQVKSTVKQVDVVVSGSEQMLDKIDKEDIRVIADVSSLRENGTHKVKLQVEGENLLVEYRLKTTQIDVTVSNG